MTIAYQTTALFRFELLMDAGNGAQKAGDILIKAFATTGRYVFIEPMIPAEISPPPRTSNSLSGVIIRVAQWDVTNIGNTTDLMICEHEILLQTRLKDREYNPNTVVLLDMADEPRNQASYAEALAEAAQAGVAVIPFQMDDESAEFIRDLRGRGKNLYYLGLLAGIFNVDLDVVRSIIQKTFRFKGEQLDKNFKIFQNGLDNVKNLVSVGHEVAVADRSGDMVLMDGNLALSAGIIDSGIKLFSGYPITPASSIMHTLAKSFSAYGGLVHQAEDEISAIGVAIGSYFAGVPAVTATSGPGFSLKQEFLGLSTATEIPVIVIDVQRGGPSTGLPTRTEQSDLLAAIYGCHGDNTKIVIGVSNVKDCFYAPHIARYLTEKLRVPVIIMSDYQTSVSYKVIEKLPANELDDVDGIADYVLDRYYINRLSDPIEMVKTNQSTPGTPEMMRRVTGINTDAGGHVTYTSESALRAHQIRNDKLHAVRAALRAPELFGSDSGDVLVVGWGSSRGAIEEAIGLCQQQGLAVSGMHIKIINPLPPMLREIFLKFKKVVTVEVAYGDNQKPGPFGTILRNETLVDVQVLIGDPSGRPLKPKGILNKVKELTHASSHH